MSGDNLSIVNCKAENVSEVIPSPGVVRFNPEIETSQGPETLADDQGEQFLERKIIQYLQKYKDQTDKKNIWPSNRGRIKKWNLVRQRFHENREVFFSGVPRVTRNHCYQSHNPHNPH